LFGLRSSCFSVTFNKEENSVVFAVKGYGHGVGMSQYAAGVIAKNGGNYKNILAKFYPGSNIAQFHQ
jgi:stage II sporulation protein D